MPRSADGAPCRDSDGDRGVGGPPLKKPRTIESNTQEGPELFSENGTECSSLLATESQSSHLVEAAAMQRIHEAFSSKRDQVEANFLVVEDVLPADVCEQQLIQLLALHCPQVCFYACPL